MVQELYQALLTHIGPTKRTPAGWETFNCVMCIHNGEPSNDTRGRGGVRMDGDKIIYHCFNCGFTTAYETGGEFWYKFRKMMKILGFNAIEIQRWLMQAEATTPLVNQLTPTHAPRTLDFEDHSLPEEAVSIFDPATQEKFRDNRLFISVAKYAIERTENCLANPDIFWTPKTEHAANRRVIIPFYWQGRTVGYTARWIGKPPSKKIPKYFSAQQPDYIYNTECIKPDRKFILVVEGPFDAIAIDGVAVLSNRISEAQARWLNSQGKRIVIVPDIDAAGGPLIDMACEQGWEVAFPNWSKNAKGDCIKDASEAVETYGYLLTLKSIIDSRVRGSTKIKLTSKMRNKIIT